jgi:hypothetical protein
LLSVPGTRLQSVRTVTQSKYFAGISRKICCTRKETGDILSCGAFCSRLFDIRAGGSGQERQKLNCSGQQAAYVKEEEVYFE